MKKKGPNYQSTHRPHSFSFQDLEKENGTEEEINESQSMENDDALNNEAEIKKENEASTLEKPSLPPHLTKEAKEEKKQKRKSLYKKTNQTIDRTYCGLRNILIGGSLVLGGIFVFGAGAAGGYFAKLVQDLPIPSEQEMDQKMHQINQRSYMYYDNGEKIATLDSDVARTKVDASEIPKTLKEAIVDTEDPYFYQHKGVVPKAILRAFLAQATGFGSPSGGSTLTQQLVKQQFLTTESSLERKAKEVLLAKRMEKYFSKQDILTTYLNVCSFGRNNKGENIAGVREAAKGIFGKSLDELNLAQIAYIAGLPQSPIIYCPYDSTGQLKSKEELKAGLQRKNIVLENMYRHGSISKTQYQEAVAYPIEKDFLPHQQKGNQSYNYLYFAIRDEATKCLMPELYEKDGYTKETIEQNQKLYQHYYNLAETKLSTNGYRIYSTIDKEIYQAMQDTVARYGSSLDIKGQPTSEVGNVLMNNQTGEIYGFVGGRDFKTNQVNHAFQTKRSPASTMKPIMVYAPAIDMDIIHSQSMLNNQYVAYKNGKQVTNYGHTTGVGFESATDALKFSHNIPVISLYQDLLKKGGVYSYIADLQLGLSKKQVNYESSPLGTNEVTVAAQTGAFACLANKGVFNAPHLIESIKDSEGNDVYRFEEENKEVFTKATASIMNEMMRHVIRDKDATGYLAAKEMEKVNKKINAGDWVGKTGTSEYNTDFWFIASTPKVTLGSWVGYDNNKKMSDKVRDNNTKYWVQLVQAVYKTKPEVLGLDQKFKLNDEVVKEKVSSQTGTLFGHCYHDGTKYTVGGKKVEAYGNSDLAFKKPTFRFGIGGTEEQYITAWKKR